MMNQSVKMLPVSLFGAVMGIVGLGLLWREASSVFGLTPLVGEALIHLGAAIFAVLAVAYMVKAARYGDAVRAEYRNAAQVGYFSTLPIGGLLLASGWLEYSPPLAEATWWISTAVLFALSLLLFSRLLTESHVIENANGSWLICMVSPVIVPLAGIPLGHPELSHFMFSIGFVMWIVLFTIVIYRTIFGPETPLALRPTWFIFIVPPSLFFTIYLDITGGELDVFSRTMFYFTMYLTLVLCFASRDVRKWPFTVAWWAFTFPFVTMSFAALTYFAAAPSGVSQAVAVLTLVLTTGIVAVVAWRTLKALLSGKLLKVPAE